jgi:hypothetical protein
LPPQFLLHVADIDFNEPILLHPRRLHVPPRACRRTSMLSVMSVSTLQHRAEF